MKIIKQTKLRDILRDVSLVLCFLWASISLAYGNQLHHISIEEAGAGKVALNLSFREAVTLPEAFVLQDPPRLVFDFPDADVAPSARSNNTQIGVIRSVRAASNRGKARIVVNMTHLTHYAMEGIGRDLILTFDSPGKQGALGSVASQTVPPDQSYYWYRDPAVAESTHHAAPKSPVAQPVVSQPVVSQPAPQPVAQPVSQPAPQAVAHAPTAHPPVPSMAAPNQAAAQQQSIHALRSVDFRREPNGSGRVIVHLPNAQARVSEEKRANTLNLILHDVDIPPNWQKRLDVTDFATPVSNIDVSQRGINGRISVIASEDFTYRTERNQHIYTVYLDKIVQESPALAPGEKEPKVFTGDKLSLNFQDIEIRAVLQLLADFTDKNIVVSDTVQGNITVRLKDVPWDQALDIVLKSRNLGMREHGNVIWVAPKPELEAKEAHELEMAKRRMELEPLVTEYISINFSKASDLARLIEQRSGGSDERAGRHSLLSNRGSVSYDERTNTLIVQDTATQVRAIRDLISVLDVPVQQVLIESRIVVANEEFGRDLGARFGMTPRWNNSGSAGIGGGRLGGADAYHGSVGAAQGSQNVALPGLNDRLSVNLPAPGAAGSFGFSILAPDFLLDLELSALQTSRRGEIVATPRVITSNQTKATIQQGVEIPYQESAASGAATVAFKKAVLSLEVTPQITPDEHISMDLRVSQDAVGDVYANVPSIQTRLVETRVLVENGQTIVLGGVHEESRQTGETKVPMLGDLPLVGQLFRQTNRSESNRELLIFVTPRIVDGKS